MGLIKTFTGLSVDPLDVRPDQIVIEDIAHALAQCNRFAGHVSAPISVAQHSVYVSLLVGSPTTYALAGLLHDASEAYLGDVTYPLKRSKAMSAYRDAESRLQRRILERFGLAPELPEIVLHYDKRMCAFEAEQGSMTLDAPLPGYEPATAVEYERFRSLRWGFIDWVSARELFLARFAELTR